MRLLLVPASILCSAFAQIALHQAGRFDHFKRSWLLWIGASAIAYGCSFFTYAALLRWFPMSRIAPVLTVGVMVLVVFAGLLFGETLGARQWLGVVLGLLAIMLLSIS